MEGSGALILLHADYQPPQDSKRLASSPSSPLHSQPKHTCCTNCDHDFMARSSEFDQLANTPWLCNDVPKQQGCLATSRLATEPFALLEQLFSHFSKGPRQCKGTALPTVRQSTDKNPSPTAPTASS